MKQTDPEEDLIDAFRVFDTHGNGLIPSKEFRDIVTNFGNKLPDEEYNEMVKEGGGEVDGHIKYEEFVKLMFAK